MEAEVRPARFLEPGRERSLTGKKKPFPRDLSIAARATEGMASPCN